ncbi:MAG TPA: nucleoside diphosphate kinase regulator [Candidatus Omnitrophota bacterium]|nr:nucleoside diphosphate kinase regulator [Candidatus Omnitrophota bacterium]
MGERKIYITTNDAERLRRLIRGITNPGDHERIYLKMLAEELLRAETLDPLKIPRDVVTMNSLVKFRDMNTREVFLYSIVYPADADFEKGKISVLAPIGMALLGYRVGDVVEWPVPAGMRRLKVEEVLYQPEAAGQYEL